MSILDRVNTRTAGARSEQRAADVPALVGTWQGKAPQAYTSTGILPDPATLAQWMRGQMADSGGLRLTTGQ
jgi:hypothetical protein